MDSFKDYRMKSLYIKENESLFPSNIRMNDIVHHPREPFMVDNIIPSSCLKGTIAFLYGDHEFPIQIEFWVAFKWHNFIPRYLMHKLFLSANSKCFLLEQCIWIACTIDMIEFYIYILKKSYTSFWSHKIA